MKLLWINVYNYRINEVILNNKIDNCGNCGKLRNYVESIFNKLE